MRTVCKFGLNCRFEIPVTLVPTPPKYFALPRIVTRFPITGPLPQTSHCLAIFGASRSQPGAIFQNDQYIHLPNIRKLKWAAELGPCERLDLWVENIGWW
jgi:hypothetical protein